MSANIVQKYDNVVHLTEGDIEYIKTSNAIGPNGYHEFTFMEDEFIRKNYKYLSDNAIAVALNIPSKLVLSRRRKLGLTKRTVNTNVTLVVWNNRKSFDEDCNKYNLIKHRGD